MKIEHVAILCNDLEKMKDFYCRYFNGTAGEIYVNAKKGFSSYFISFEDGARIELMHKKQIQSVKGTWHIAFSVGTKERVDEMTDKMSIDGVKVMGLPRVTGDGYYESIVFDPEDNEIEITI